MLFPLAVVKATEEAVKKRKEKAHPCGENCKCAKENDGKRDGEKCKCKKD